MADARVQEDFPAKPDGHDPGAWDCWLRFNDELSSDGGCLLNEAAIARRLARLERMDVDDPRIYWLTLARLTEVTLLQAGAYADACEFRAAGDLLVNPRRIDLRVRGQSKTVVKDRHGGLSDQFAPMMGGEAPAEWLRRNVHPQIREAALLPHLTQMLASSGYIASGYLDALSRRMEKVAHTMAFLCAWPVTDSADLYRRIQSSPPAERAFILSNLCRFEKDRLFAMGRAVERLRRPDHGGSISSRGYEPFPRSCLR